MALNVATMQANAMSAFRSVTVTYFFIFIGVLVFLQQPQVILTMEEEIALKEFPLDGYNFLMGISQLGAHYERGTQCGKELNVLLEAIASKELWGLKVIDSFGGVPQAFYWGNYFWFGAQDLCEDLNTPYGITFSQSHAKYRDFNTTSPFPLEFTVIHADFKSPHFIDLKLPFKYFLHMGLCLPRACSAAAIFNYTTRYFREGRFDLQRDFELQLQPIDSRRPHFSWSYFGQTGTIIYIFTCIFVISLIIIAEFVYKSRLRLQTQNQLHVKQHPQTEMELGVGVGVGYAKSTESIAMLEKLLMCFRLPENYSRAITLEKRKQSSQQFLSAIAGLRTIICLWVTVFHVYYYSLFAMSNAPLIFAKLEHFALQPIMQACFYVDVFFVMSAFLLVYNFLQNKSQRKLIRKNSLYENLKMYGKAVLHRYLRLTPVMIITMLLSDMVYDLLNLYSPFHLGENSGIYCKRNWWYNLLYIHNLLDMKEICCSWTWYLACEMQYFILFTALLYAYAKRPQLTRVVFCVLTFILVINTWLCNYRNGISFQIDVIHTTLNKLYVKPWVRINPYIGGAIAGWILHRCHQKQQKQQPQMNNNHNINTITNETTSPTSSPPPQQQQTTTTTTTRTRTRTSSPCVFSSMKFISETIAQRIWRPLFWTTCFALYVATNFMSYWRNTPVWVVAAIMSFGKLLFALLIGGVIVMCALGRGGLLQKLLSMRLLQFLNRFCFSIYMLAPVIVVAVFGLRRVAISFTEVGSGMDFVAIIALSISSAFILVLLVELPTQRISNVLLQRNYGGVRK